MSVLVYDCFFYLFIVFQTDKKQTFTVRRKIHAPPQKNGGTAIKKHAAGIFTSRVLFFTG